MRKPTHGDIFAVPLPDGAFICGRVLLDIPGTVKERVLPHDSPLLFVRSCYLIELFSEVQSTPDYVPSPVRVCGVFVQSREVGKSWPLVGNIPVDPKLVEFPETLCGFRHRGGESAFSCGEIWVPLPVPELDIRRMNVYKSSYSVFLWPFTCLRLLGRGAAIPDIAKINSVLSHDLRLSPHRAEIYKHLPFRMEQSYFEKQAQLGLHFERLYE